MANELPIPGMMLDPLHAPPMPGAKPPAQGMPIPTTGAPPPAPIPGIIPTTHISAGNPILPKSHGPQVTRNVDTIPMVGGDQVEYQIRKAEVKTAESAGFYRSKMMYGPDGVGYPIRVDKLKDALEAGFSANAPTPVEDAKGGPEHRGAVDRFATNVGTAMGMPEGAMHRPMDVPEGLITAGKHPGLWMESLGEMGKGLVGAQSGLLNRGVEEWKKPGVSTKIDAVTHIGERAVPIYGPMFSSAVDKIQEGDIAGGLGTLIGMSAPTLANKGVRTGIVDATRTGAGATARGLRSASEGTAGRMTGVGRGEPARAVAKDAPFIATQRGLVKSLKERAIKATNEGRLDHASNLTKAADSLQKRVQASDAREIGSSLWHILRPKGIQSPTEGVVLGAASAITAMLNRDVSLHSPTSIGKAVFEASAIGALQSAAKTVPVRLMVNFVRNVAADLAEAASKPSGPQMPTGVGGAHLNWFKPPDNGPGGGGPSKPPNGPTGPVDPVAIIKTNVERLRDPKTGRWLSKAESEKVRQNPQSGGPNSGSQAPTAPAAPKPPNGPTPSPAEPVKPPERGGGTDAEVKAENDHWEQAKKELGPNATTSEIALKAQELKVLSQGLTKPEEIAENTRQHESGVSSAEKMLDELRKKKAEKEAASKPPDSDVPHQTDAQRRVTEGEAGKAPSSKSGESESYLEGRTSADRWENQMHELDIRKAPDSEYRSILSTGAIDSLKKGETWRSRVQKYIELSGKPLGPMSQGPAKPPEGSSPKKPMGTVKSQREQFDEWVEKFKKEHKGELPTRIDKEEFLWNTFGKGKKPPSKD